MHNDYQETRLDIHISSGKHTVQILQRILAFHCSVWF